MEHDHWSCGLHSGMPECCIRWAAPSRYDPDFPPFIDRYDHAVGPMDRDWRNPFATGPTNWFGFPIHGGWRFCPNHKWGGSRVRIRVCPDRVKHSIWYYEQESIRQATARTLRRHAARVM